MIIIPLKNYLKILLFKIRENFIKSREWSPGNSAESKNSVR